jgi:hypothetical protein
MDLSAGADQSLIAWKTPFSSEGARSIRIWQRSFSIIEESAVCSAGGAFS